MAGQLPSAHATRSVRLAGPGIAGPRIAGPGIAGPGIAGATLVAGAHGVTTTVPTMKGWMVHR
ncbi:hypothetical protein FRAAL4119 [Frankia alni ACN14a]|uniref:Uncharacterized protein n=1 Tax=Frankia alni (strain DSM 45986 / CECT 9034 / ACN14a) TaxID=326424 RepID=Q0RIA9_FRAAA|nr:hypothetical protein FRAAL4119 [Frankia alni ACN14a]